MRQTSKLGNFGVCSLIKYAEIEVEYGKTQ